MKKLLASGEVNNLNIMSVSNLSKNSKKTKKQALIGISIFMLSIFIMLILTASYGPIKG